MRIAIDYRNALVNREGIGRYTRELVRALVKLEDAQDLVLLGHTLARARFNHAELGLENTSAELVRLRLPSKALDWLLRRTGRGADQLLGGAAVYHHTAPHTLPLVSAKSVVTIHDCIYTLDGDGRLAAEQRPGYMEQAAAQRMTAQAKAAVEDAAVVITPSEYSGVEAVMALGVHPGRVHVTPLGCDHILRGLAPGESPSAERPLGKGAHHKTPTILTVTRVDPRKNHLRMLSAFENIVRDGFPHRWIIAGPPGWGSETFAAALESSPARARIQWLRATPENELARLYRRADLFFFASLNEGFGLPPLEAMACGTPVVTSCVTSLPEVCGAAAAFVEPTDVEQMTDTLRSVLKDREQLADLARRGLERAARYTWEACARRTLRAYQDAARESAGEPNLKRSL
ncbi:MAG: glycosyltransferase family 1 protein [Planctomycetota bacterium]|nr:glycosyltransferase family 1 protein [Planctomycetota bacterium]